MNKKNSALSNQAKKEIERNIIAAIIGLQETDDLNNEYSLPFMKFSNEALKTKNAWMSSGDISQLFYEAIYAQKGEIAKELNEDVLDADLYGEKYKLDADKISSVSNYIISTLESIPKEYTVKFPIPIANFDHDIIINDDISIISEKHSNKGLHSKTYPPYIKIKIQGYITNNREQQSMREVSSKLKQFIQIAVAKKVFIRGFNIKSHFHFHNNATQEILAAVINEEINSGKEINQIPLTVGMSEYLSRLKLPSVFIPSKDQLEKLQETMKMMQSPSSHENSLAIKSALEWSFDAEADDDEKMRFIKTCIGLEAVLGEASESGGITERLADRCAYLLKKTTTQRKNARDHVREIYQLRSKLVHGAVTRLSHSDDQLAKLGKNYLDAVINAELLSLESWWEGAASSRSDASTYPPQK